MYDAVVIGAGMSGLAAGIRLAHFGRKAVVLERHSLWGGLNSFYKKDGHRFDVGLHAMTNFATRGSRGPLSKVCRQLRLDWDRLALRPQVRSSVRFPSAELAFSNDVRLLESEIERRFPGEIDGFRKLRETVEAYDDGTLDPVQESARDRMSAFLREPLLVDLLLCPLLFYGSATAGDMHWHPFAILFRAVYLEGFCRPDGGVRPFLDLLRRSYLEKGGELRLKCGVERLETVPGGGVVVHLDDGSRIETKKVLSSAGRHETARLLGIDDGGPGEMTFVESLFLVDEPPEAWGWGDAILFFSHDDRFRYRPPAGPVDTQSGIVCCPTNFPGQLKPPEAMVRVTSLARFGFWEHAKREGEAAYSSEKAAFQAAQLDSVSKWFPNLASRITYRDSFTPHTIRRYTGHDNGAVYGAAAKRWDGRSPVPDVHLCGTDQGYLGIVGALLSGALMANKHVLTDSTVTTVHVLRQG